MKTMLQHYTILYAEDDKAVQNSTKEYLNRYFKHVHTANDGKETLALYRSCHPDALLLDIDMPHLDGLSVAREIRKEDEKTLIVMLTAYTDVNMLLEATELNLCKYLVKPMTLPSIKEALQSVAEKLHKLTSHVIYLSEGYKWDKESEILYYNNMAIVLTQKEKLLLSLFMKHYNHCVTFEEIIASVWKDGFDTDISIQSVKLQVTLLRKKLPKESIKNIYGKGYILK